MSTKILMSISERSDLLSKDQNSFDDDRGARLDALRFLMALKIRKVVRGRVDRFARAQSPHVLGEQRRIHRIGMIEVYANALFVGELRVVLVVVVLLKDCDAFRRKRLNDAARDGGLARSRAAADPDDERPLAGCVDCGLRLSRRVDCANSAR